MIAFLKMIRLFIKIVAIFFAICIGIFVIFCTVYILYQKYRPIIIDVHSNKSEQEKQNDVKKIKEIISFLKNYKPKDQEVMPLSKMTSINDGYICFLPPYYSAKLANEFEKNIGIDKVLIESNYYIDDRVTAIAVINGNQYTIAQIDRRGYTSFSNSFNIEQQEKASQDYKTNIPKNFKYSVCSDFKKSAILKLYFDQKDLNKTYQYLSSGEIE